MRLKRILPLAAILMIALPAGTAFAAPKPKFRFETASKSVTESGGTVSIKVTRAGRGGRKAITTVASVGYSVAGTATWGVDYTNATVTNGDGSTAPASQNGRLSFASGEVSKTLSFDVVDDTIPNEGVEKIALSLKDAIGGTITNPRAANISIVDNDGPTQVQLDSLTYPMSESDTVATTVQVLRSGDLTGSSTVQLAETNGTATLGSDFTMSGSNPQTVSFAAGEWEKDVTLTVVDDSSKETTENFSLALSNAAGTPATTLGAITSATGSIADNDAAPVFYLDPTAIYSLGEGDGGQDVTIIRDTDPSIPGTFDSNGTFTVDWNTADGTAVAPGDYTASPASPDNTVSYDPGETSQTVTIPVIDDTLSEGNETFGVSLANPSLGAVGTPGSETVTIVDNDPPVVTQPTDGNTNGTTGNNAGAGNGSAGDQGSQIVLGARQSACGLVVKASKAQKLLKKKVLLLKLRASQRCKVSLSATLKQLRAHSKSAQLVRALRLKSKKTSLTLQPGKAVTVKVKFTKKTLKAITKALQARNRKLVATVLVTELDSSSVSKRRTMKITVRR